MQLGSDAAMGGRISAGAPYCSAGVGDWGWEIEPQGLKAP